MDCIKKELEYTTQELSIQRAQVTNQKAEFEKEIERLLFDNREIKEQSRKTQRELSKEITSLTGELKDERDRIHELQKENRKLRQEVKTRKIPYLTPRMSRETAILVKNSKIFSNSIFWKNLGMHQFNFFCSSTALLRPLYFDLFTVLSNLDFLLVEKYRSK